MKKHHTRKACAIHVSYIILVEFTQVSWLNKLDGEEKKRMICETYYSLYSE